MTDPRHRDDRVRSGGPGRIRHAANLSLLYPELPLAERAAAAADDGFAGVEILFPYDVDAAGLRRTFDDAGVTAVLVNTPPGRDDERGLAAVPGAEERFRAAFGLALDTAGVLGAGRVHTMAGTVPDGVTTARAVRTLVENLRWAAPRAAAKDITLTLEALNRHDFPGYTYSVPAEVLAVVAELDDPAVRLQFDLYHTAREGLDVVAELEAALPWVGHVQIAGPPGRHEPTAAHGDLFEALHRLAGAGYDGWLGFEYRPAGDTTTGLAWRDLLTQRPDGDGDGATPS